MLPILVGRAGLAGTQSRSDRSGEYFPERFEHVSDVVAPGQARERTLARARPGGFSPLRVLDHETDRANQLGDVARRGEKRALLRAGNGREPFEITVADAGGARQHLSDLSPLARHDPAAHRHVLE